MRFSGPECPKIDGGWGFASDPTGGAYSAPRPLAGFRGRAHWERDGEMDGKRRGDRKREGDRVGRGLDA